MVNSLFFLNELINNGADSLEGVAGLVGEQSGEESLVKRLFFE